ncbi:hypothetical protein BC938DRAFT_481113 [Jimgerdemannia flammicorona]|uniref:AAA-ATPase-like domain-containing protein n=1 Tax=Jimgerdemannia flammicorona TaxID=994334 RepID=A0A433QGT9_9FUNG|nr:hypothetical protein BC938DRAFT_481113 [Jimgerdemannia flammicorona]
MRRGNCSRSIFASIRSSSSISSKTWELTQEKLRGILANLYKEHGYVRDRLDSFDKQRCNLSTHGRQLSEHLRIYYGRKCIVLISEYDHPLDIAFQHNFYDSACDFFRTLFGSLLKVTLLVGVTRVAKSGYLSDFNNVMVYPMFDSLFADKLGFTEEVVVLVGHHRMDMKGGRKQYLSLQPLVRQFVHSEKDYWVDTASTRTIQKLILYSKATFKNIAARLLNGDVIEARLKDNLCYDDLFRRADDALWTLLYYAGYLSHEEDLSNRANRYRSHEAAHPNAEVSTEWLGWLQLPGTPPLNSVAAILEYKINKKKQDQAIEKKVKEALSQIEYKKYRQEVSEDIEQLVEVGIAFQGKLVVIVGKFIAQKVENEDEEDEKDEDDM